ncbi:hypothetical protein MCOR27_006442 [Pyricularia oryzae]|uniref:EKC/KEOPS complex subunit CGI121 n=1 Tax=Pyricularia grisea TaxID=148305 RepID=A0ABQ8NW49_PYRGI|nr:hypothetical protein MCOR01_002958 [Pyricularia oryzae]KAI6302894.1 hypothetical protein MCOR33_001803 [Pyricularia grisea]KAI6253536.1 hypothetical protein MCOR19_009899 [Pyricularia oryzae]KAI6276449.1 hypothetical protein MCOR27_006442 [Pyricularia oryzae]KAI6288459.1 hypothetical protein MCOR26_000061 [Pyricularia oryzae]
MSAPAIDPAGGDGPAIPPIDTTNSDTPTTTQLPSLLSQIPLEHIPSTHTVHAALFRDVSNAAHLHSQLLARNPAFEYALIDASAVASTAQVLAAVFRALTALLGGGLRTPNVHSETVFCLSPSNNITEAYRRFGISPSTKDVIVIKVLFPAEDAENAAPSPADVWAHLCANVQGTVLPFTDESISPLTDWAKVRKYYKLNAAPALAGLKNEDIKRKESEMLILGAMALRGV